MDPYYKSQEFLDLLAKYENMRDNNADGFIDAADYADLAEYYLAKADEARAKEAVERGVEIFPDSLPPLSVLARIELSHGRIDEAKKLIERAEDQDELEYHYLHAEIMIAEGNPNEADRYLSTLETDDDPDDIALDICAIFIDHNEFKLAKKWLNKVKDRSKKDVQDFEAHILTGEGNFEEGEKKMNELLDEDPYSTEHWNHLAGVQYQKGDFNASMESSDFALAIDPNNAEALLNKANSFYALNNYEQALIYYECFVQMRPDNITASYFHGVTLAILKRHDEAVKSLRLTLKHALKACQEGDSTCEDLLIDILNELACELSETDSYDEALSLLDQALHTIQNNADMDDVRSDIYLCQAKLYFLKGDAEGAINSFEQARTINDTPETFVRMTAVLYECGYPDRAFDFLGAKLFSEDGQNWTTGHAYLARYAYTLGRTDVYNVLLAIALERNPNEAQQVLYDLYPAGTKPQDYPYTPITPPEE